MRELLSERPGPAIIYAPSRDKAEKLRERPLLRAAVWVGDIGDNDEARDSISVTRVPVGRGERTVDEESYELVHPHGPANAETLLAHPGTGRLYVATKDVFGGELLEAPEHLAADEPNRLRPLGHVLSLATDGAFFPDGKHIVLRDYSRAVVYTFPGLVEIASFPLPSQEQGEGIAVEADGTGSESPACGPGGASATPSGMTSRTPWLQKARVSIASLSLARRRAPRARRPRRPRWRRCCRTTS